MLASGKQATMWCTARGEKPFATGLEVDAGPHQGAADACFRRLGAAAVRRGV